MFLYFLNLWFAFVNSGLLWHEVVHLLVLLPSMYLLWCKSGSKILVFLVFMFGFFMDIDHFIDYWIYKGGINFDLIEFLRLEYFDGNGRALIIFHGWEYVLISFLVFVKRGWKNMFASLWLGMAPHLIWDSISVGSLWFYSLLYRFHSGFSLPN